MRRTDRAALAAFGRDTSAVASRTTLCTVVASLTATTREEHG